MGFLATLNEAAKVAMRDVLGMREGEEVLIITNFEGDVFPIAKAVFEQTKALGGKPVLMVQEQKTTYTYAERLVLEAMRANPDIYVSMSSSKLGKDSYGLNMGYIGRDGKKYDHITDKLMDGDRRIRGFWSPTANVEMFKRCVAVDYDEMQAQAARLKKALDGGKEVHVTAPGGTDVTISIEGRKAMADDGNFRLPGTGGNLPAGEVFVSPVVGSTEGVIAFDGTVDLVPESTIPKRPVVVSFKDGYVDAIKGGKVAADLLKVIQKGEAMAREKGLKKEEKNARHLGELGIGINPAAKMTGNLLEDEKLLKTVHFAIGSNYDFDAEALIHQDCLVRLPNVWVDGKQIMKNGDLLDTF